MKLIYFIIITIIILTPACSFMDPSDKNNIQPTYCEKNYDCLTDEICDANYCVSSKIEESKAKFTLSFIPNNTLNNNKYYHSLETEMLSGKDLSIYDNFKIEVSDYIEFSGEIRNNKNMDLSYELIIYNEEKNIKFYNHSYKDGDKTYFHFKIPKTEYKIKISPNSYYPPFTIDLGRLDLDTKDYLIVVDREINSQNYSNISGAIKVALDDSFYYPSSYKIHAFIQENNSEIPISNKFTCNDECDNFELTIFNTDKDIYLKITVDLLENIEFKIPLKDFDNIQDNFEIDLGSFHLSNFNILNLIGKCNQEFKNTEIKVTGNLNKYAKYKKTFNYTCDYANCENSFNLYKGNFNLFIKPSPTSCHNSKFFNIDLYQEPIIISINLEEKKNVSGILVSTSGNSVEGVVTFTKKDNSLTDFKFVTYSNQSGEFNALLEPGEYDVFIEPKSFSINNSNWMYLNQRITVNTSDLLYLVPRSYKIPLYLYAQGNKPLIQAQVTMNLHNLDEIFSDENGYLYPKSYPLYESITDTEGKFILSVPIIE